MRIADCGLRNRRQAVTIMEVLFATMITGVGLLAALTLLPVAATQAQRARNADASVSAATAAVGYFDAMGMRRPANWVAYDATTGNPRNLWNEFQQNLVYKQWLFNQVPPPPPAGYHWLDGLDSFCIDPRMTAANQKDNSDPTLGVVIGAGTFPRNVAAGQPAMWRLGLANGGTPMNRLMANTVFTIDDDLNYDHFATNALGQRVEDESFVATQIFDVLPEDATLPAANQRRSRRAIDGRLSWMATITPKLDRYSAILTDTFVLSIVVFYDRPANLGINADPVNERALGVPSLPGLGVTGGEVVLGWPNPPATIATPTPATEETAKAMLNVHTNEWIMLAGQVLHQDANPSLPGLQPGNVSVFKWYRVTDSDPEIQYNAAAQQYQRFVTLSGQDWVAANTRAVAMEGVVGVVEKTIRLEP